MSEELNRAVKGLATAFEEFKSANDERLKAIESNRGVAELDEKLERINSDIDKFSDLKQRLEDLETKAHRPSFPGREEPSDAARDAHKKAFDLFMRKGEEAPLQEVMMEHKALNVGTPSEGGHTVPEQLDRSILDLVLDISPIRQIAGRVVVGTSDYKKYVNLRGTASGWVGETAARPETGTPTFGEVDPPMGEIYANPGITQMMLDDSFLDAEGWLAQEVASEFAQEEGAAFVSGNGTNKPKGFAAYTTAATADASRAFGTLEHVATGVSGDWAASDPHEVLIDVSYALKQALRANARWVMAKSVLASVRKMKDGDGNLIWQPGLASGQPQTLMGYPITEAEDMAAIGADSLSIAFGDFRRGYMVVDRIGTRVLRDPYTNKPYVHFYTTKRVGGAVVDSEAIKFVKFSTT